MGARGPKPMPANVHHIRGNPSKLNLGAVDSGRISIYAEAPDMPRSMPGEAKKVWKEVVPLLLELGVIGRVDKRTLETYCRTVVDLQRLERAHEAKVSLIEQAGGDVSEAYLYKTPTGFDRESKLHNKIMALRHSVKQFGDTYGMSADARRKPDPGIQRSLFSDDEQDGDKGDKGYAAL